MYVNSFPAVKCGEVIHGGNPLDALDLDFWDIFLAYFGFGRGIADWTIDGASLDAGEAAALRT